MNLTKLSPRNPLLSTKVDEITKTQLEDAPPPKDSEFKTPTEMNSTSDKFFYSTLNLGKTKKNFFKYEGFPIKPELQIEDKPALIPSTKISDTRQDLLP